MKMSVKHGMALIANFYKSTALMEDDAYSSCHLLRNCLDDGGGGLYYKI